MTGMPIDVEQKFNAYPQNARNVLLELRALVFQLAQEQQLGEVAEQLKWGEPSYSVKSGSPIRIDWKARAPNHIAIYLHCGTRLIETFRELYPTELSYQGNRAIILPLAEPLPIKVISQCLRLALQYHQLKHLPLLGQ